MLREGESIRRLVELVLKLGSEEDKRSRKASARSFARTEILLHAMSVFNQQGLEETSVQDLLDAANISRRTFYKYFSSKIDVLENIYTLASRVMVARFESELPAFATRDAFIDGFLAIYFDYQLSVGRIIGLMMEEALRSASPLAAHRRVMLDKVTVILQREFARLGMPAVPYWQLMGLLWALEGASLQLLSGPALTAADMAACRRDMQTLWGQALP